MSVAALQAPDVALIILGIAFLAFCAFAMFGGWD
jgi:hypothetical protein